MGFGLMTLHKRSQLCILLVILLLEAFLRNLPLERLNLVEFANRFLIKAVYAFEGALPNSLLMVRQ